MARVLVVEDNRTNLDLMIYLLEAYHHSVLVAPTGEEGVEQARRERPDLVICDLQLPGIDGYEVMRQIKSTTAAVRIPIIAVTAYAMVGDRDKALAAGFDGYIPKPIIPESFVREIQAFLAPGQRSHARAVEHEAVEAPTKPPSRATVLVVDDSPTNLSLIRSTLEPFGYGVLAVGSVAEALQSLENHVPDMILSDLHMPERNGFELIRAVKGDPILARIPFVFISSSLWGASDRAKFLSLGDVRLLSRPIEPRTLLAEIEDSLARKES